MENIILSKYFICVSILIVLTLYCISVVYLIYISDFKKIKKICISPNRLLLITLILHFILASYLMYILLRPQEKMQMYNFKSNQSESTLKAPISKANPEMLFLKTYLKTYYKKVPDEIEDIITKAVDNLSHKYDINFSLVVGIIGVESSFNPYATSKVRARGLMQVRYCIWKDYLNIPNAMTLHNIHEGIEYGILAFLQCKKEAKGDLEKALQKYSGTKGQTYIRKINKEIDRFMLLKSKGGLTSGSQLNQGLFSTNKRKTK